MQVQFQCKKNSSISNNSVISKQFKCKYGLIVKNISISSYLV